MQWAEAALRDFFCNADELRESAWLDVVALRTQLLGYGLLLRVVYSGQDADRDVSKRGLPANPSEGFEVIGQRHGQRQDNGGGQGVAGAVCKLAASGKVVDELLVGFDSVDGVFDARLFECELDKQGVLRVGFR